jgi:glycosyltransferase involved in cell wall biosynthesis
VRVALVHDWLTGMRGGERVLDVLATLFPDAELFTLVHVPGSTSPAIERLRIHASPLSALPGIARHYRKLLPLFPAAIERFRLEGFDLVVSSHHAVAKGVRIAKGTPHLCYCHTPMRYIWDQANAYLGHGLRRTLSMPLVRALRRFDVRTSSPVHVSRFVANSRTVAGRIERHYHRRAPVVYPPVDVARIRPSERPPQDFYLLVGGFVPYKREEIAIEAFRRLGRRLIVAGDGPRRRSLAAGAPPNVEFTGRISDDALAGLYADCRALVYPQEEDFGIVAVEAQAAGRPVVAFGRGGAAETVVPLDLLQAPDAKPATGLFFDQQTPEAIEEAVRRFEAVEVQFRPEEIRRHAEGFSVPRFCGEIRTQIDRCLAREDDEASWPSGLRGAEPGPQRPAPG